MIRKLGLQQRWAYATLAATTLVAAALLSSAASAAEIAPSANEIRPVLIGSTVPDVAVHALDGSSVALHDAIGDQPTVLVFYRGGWCPFCSTQLADLRHTIDPLKKLGVRMIALSGDAPETLASMPDETDPGFTLLSDSELVAAKAFGLAFQVSDEYMEKLAKYGLDVSGNSVSSLQALPVPAGFVVGADKTITFSYVNPNYRVRCDADVLLAAAKAAATQP